MRESEENYLDPERYASWSGTSKREEESFAEVAESEQEPLVRLPDESYKDFERRVVAAAEQERRVRVDPEVFQALADSYVEQGSKSVSLELAMTWELREDGSDQSLERYLETLLHSKSPHDVIRLRNCLAFTRGYMWEVQNETEKIEENGEYYGGLFFRLHRLAQQQQQETDSYLTKALLRDIEQSINVYNGDHPSGKGLAGVAGGASDDAAYRYGHIVDSYQYHIGYGIPGSVAGQPAVAIAPGYMAVYGGERCKSVYPVTVDAAKACKEIEQKYIAKNDPQYEYIYDTLNTPVTLRGRTANPSNLLRRLEDIWQFKDDLKADGSQFFYDLSRIDVSILHPIVLTDILQHNQDYIVSSEQVLPTVEPLTEEELAARLFPTGSQQQEKMATYRTMTEMHMLQKLEDDFGINIAQESFWVQRNFLEFLERTSVDEVEQLQDFVQRFGSDGLRTFLVGELGNITLQDIVHIADGLSESAAKTLFSKFGEIVRDADALRAFVEQHAQKGAQTVTKLESFVQHVLVRGRDFLQQTAHKLRVSGEVDESAAMEGIESINSDVVVFSTLCKHMAKENGGTLDLRDLAAAKVEEYTGDRLPAAYRHVMRDIFVKNRPTYTPELLRSVLEEFDTAIRDHRAKWEILRVHGDIVAFIRFEERAPGVLYAGSLNVRDEARGSAIGTSFLHSTIERVAVDNVIEAVVKKDNPMARRYTTDFRMSVVGEDTNYHGTGETYQVLRRDDRATSTNQASMPLAA